MNNLANSDDKPKWGGPRPNSGRPKGSMNPASIERAATKAAFQSRVFQNADRLFNAQFNLAVGEQYLMHKYMVGSGSKARMVVDVVDDPEIIKKFINDELDDVEDEYYYLSTKPANGYAVDSLLDRAFGKADSKLELSSDPENPLYPPADKTVVDAFIERLKNDTSKAKSD